MGRLAGLVAADGSGRQGCPSVERRPLWAVQLVLRDDRYRSAVLMSAFDLPHPDVVGLDEVHPLLVFAGTPISPSPTTGRWRR